MFAPKCFQPYVEAMNAIGTPFSLHKINFYLLTHQQHPSVAIPKNSPKK